MLSKNCLIILITLFVFRLDIYNQDTIIEFDRPGVADLPYINPLNSFQIEAGYDFEYSDSLGIQFDITPAILLRYSFVKYFELRLEFNHQPLSNYYNRLCNDLDLYHFAIGYKLKICKEKRALPELALTNIITFPTRGFIEPNIDWVGTEVYLLANNNVTDYFFINYNIGYLYGNNYIKHSFHYNISLNFLVSKKIGLFTEHYAYINFNGSNDFGFDGGLYYFPISRIQLDLSYYYIHSLYDNHVFSTGISYNISTKNRKKRRL